MNQNDKKPTAAVGGGRKFKNDVIFIGVLLLVTVTLGAAFFLLREEGNAVTVTVDGKEYGVYALSEDRVVEIRTGDAGEHLNRLVIRDGRAFVETATCPDGICAAHKPIYRDGESIICLPHKVVVTVIKTYEGGPDVIA
ncbi:MAG: NusG domain II-containing protein [Ruminococcaceae bacterium]|nr:NusG domain II-containing protein [Oscillospiraceae bacterium]